MDDLGAQRRGKVEDIAVERDNEEQGIMTEAAEERYEVGVRVNRYPLLSSEKHTSFRGSMLAFMVASLQGPPS